jgi:starvation-inducible DNA-binding protein
MIMAAVKNSSSPKYGVPGLGKKDATLVIDLLQDRLNSLNDLALTLKHIHWNVVGPQFIGVHTMLDETAERIATLGGSPQGTPGAIVAARSWDDYSLGRDDAIAHLGALDVVYAGIIEAHRKAIAATEEPDPVTQDMLIGQAGQLEQYHWFVRAHLEKPGGSLRTGGATTERKAAARARQ